MCKRIFVLFIMHSVLLQAAALELTSKRGLSPMSPAFVPGAVHSAEIVPVYRIYPIVGVLMPSYLAYFVPMSSTPVVEQDSTPEPYLTDLQRACADGFIVDVEQCLQGDASLTFPTETGAHPLTLVLHAQQVSEDDCYDLCEMLLQKAKNRGEDIASLLDGNGEAPILIALKSAKGRKEKLRIADLILDHTNNVKILDVALEYVTRNQGQKISAEYVQYFVNKIGDKKREHNLLAYIAQLAWGAIGFLVACV